MCRQGSRVIKKRHSAEVRQAHVAEKKKKRGKAKRKRIQRSRLPKPKNGKGDIIVSKKNQHRHIYRVKKNN